MTHEHEDRRHFDRRIAERLLEFGAEFGDFHPGFPGESGGVHVLHRLRDGKVEVREVAGEELERLRRFVSDFEAEPGPGMAQSELDRLSAELDRPGPDLDAVETSLRDGGNAVAALQMKRLLERKDATLPAPVCPGCGRAMKREREKRPKTFTCRMGPVTVERSLWRCRGCGGTAVPLDEWLKLEGKSMMPGAERMAMSALAELGGRRACAMIRELSGVRISRSRLDREGRRLGREAVEFERQDVAEASQGPRRAVVLVDGTGVPVRKAELAGSRGRREGQDARTKEAKVLRICEMERRKGDGKVHAVAGTTTQSAMIDTAEVGPGGGGHSDFGMRLRREALRRGTLLAGEVVVVSDGAAWIENTANTVFAGRKVIFVLDLFHVLEKLWAALQELIADDAERDAAWTRLKSLIRDGKAKEVADELAPHAERHGKVREFVNHSRANLHRMKYDLHRSLDMPEGSGAVESSCKHLVAERLKKSGCRWVDVGGKRDHGDSLLHRKRPGCGFLRVKGRRLTAQIWDAP